MVKIQAEILSNSAIDYQSKEFKKFSAATKELFGNTSLDKFKKDAEDVSIFKRITIARSTAPEIKKIKEYYETSFKRYHKDIDVKNILKGETAVIHDSAQDVKIIDELITRLAFSLGSFGTTDLTSALSANPDVAADLGKILLAKEALEKHERKLSAILRFEKTKKEVNNNLADFFWKNPTEWFGEVMKSTITLKPNIGKTFGACFKMAGKTTWSGLKLMGGTLALLETYINKEINK